MKKILLALVLSIYMVALASCTVDDTPVTKVDDANVTDVENSSETESSNTNNIAKVGETLERGGIQFTFDYITKYVDNSEYISDTPDEGKEYILLWFTVQNTTDEDYFTNMFYEDSYCDGFSISSESLLVNADGESVWGDVAAGKAKKGYVAYQLPIEWKTIEFQYKPIFSGQESKLIFQATPEDIQ